MRKTIFYLCVLVSSFCFGQESIGIGTLSPNPSAALEVSSTNKGVLFPSVALQGELDTTTIAHGNVNGLVVYNTSNLGGLDEGFYYWKDKWTSMTSVESLTGLSKLAFTKMSTGASVKKYRSDQPIPGFTFTYKPDSNGTLDISANIYSTLSSNQNANIPSNTLIKIKVNGETIATGINCPIVIAGLVSNPTMISMRSGIPVLKGQSYNFEITSTEVFANANTDANGSYSGTVVWNDYSAESSFIAYLIQD